MKSLLQFVFFSLLSVLSFAQGENNIWAFGQGYGLDFNSGSPVVIGTALNTLEGSASVCGKNGKLKFYSDGFKALNQKHKMMPNGDALLTNGSVTQGVVIVPFPDDTNKYYLFVLHAVGTNAAYYLNYSVVDMELDGGLGDIIVDKKNITLDDSLSEKMLVTRAFGCAYWLIVRHGYSSEFRSFKISSSGVDMNPIVTKTAFVGNGINFIGEMKMSPNNQKIVLANWQSRGQLGSIELFDFDSSSGRMNNRWVIDSSKLLSAYGVEFSPDNTKLYAAYGEDEPRPPYPLVQFNLELLPDISLVRSSKTILATSYNWGGMRASRDKIYGIQSSGLATNIYAINKPNEAGTACSFKDSLFIFGSACFGLGNRLPDSPPPIFRITDTAICQSITYSGAKGYAYYLWSDGSTDPTHLITPPATFWVESSNGNCGSEIVDTFKVKSKELAMSLGTDVLRCRDSTVTLLCPLNNANYLWSNGSNTQSVTVNKSDIYWVKVNQGDCVVSDTVYVRLGDCEKCITIPNAFTPNNDGKNDFFCSITSCPVLQYSLKIFNRYGQMVFTTDKVNQVWDGTFNGQALDIGVYYYLVKVSFDKLGTVEEFYKGDLSLLR
jgi:gliding motility-associated-like protein